MSSNREDQFYNLLVHHAGIPAQDIVKEYQFYRERNWRADFHVPKANMLLEVEGGTESTRTPSRHTSIVGYRNDCAKYSVASALGFTLIRTTTNTEQMMAMAELAGKVYRAKTK